MTNRELEKASEIARSAVIEAGRKLKPHYGNIALDLKDNDSGVMGVVTKLDHSTEELLEARLSTFSPNVGFRGEEHGTKSKGSTTWLVDPIDGTAHFIRGLPFCTTMVSLIEAGAVVLAVIYDFVNDNTYWAVRGQGAFCNEQRISVGKRSLKESIISFEASLKKPEHIEKFLAAREKASLFASVNAGFEMAMVASGKLDARIGLAPYGFDWDYAPGSLLVSEAGGIATNIGKETYDYRNHDYIIGNPVVHAELTQGPDAIFPIGWS